MVSIPYLDTMNFGGIVSNLMYWLGYILLIVLILGAFIAVYLLFGYKYKVTIFERRGLGRPLKEGEEEDHSVGKISKDRAKEIKTKSGIIKWQFLISRKTIQPPDYKCIYPGNRLFLYRTSPSDFHPLQFLCNDEDGHFTPTPQHTKSWEQLEMQQAAEDYTKKSFFDQYGNVIVMMGTVMFCLILVGVTVYYTYQHANQVVPALSGLSDVIKNNNLIAGIS